MQRQEQRVGQVTPMHMEVMLGEPGGVIPKPVSQLHLRAHLGKNLRAGSLKVTLYVIRQDGLNRHSEHR